MKINKLTKKDLAEINKLPYYEQENAVLEHVVEGYNRLSRKYRAIGMQVDYETHHVTTWHVHETDSVLPEEIVIIIDESYDFNKIEDVHVFDYLGKYLNK